MNTGSHMNILLVVIVLLLAAILGVVIYEANQPDTFGEHVQQGMEDLGDSIEDAAR